MQEMFQLEVFSSSNFEILSSCFAHSSGKPLFSDFKFFTFFFDLFDCTICMHFKDFEKPLFQINP